MPLPDLAVQLDDKENKLYIILLDNHGRPLLKLDQEEYYMLARQIDALINEASNKAQELVRQGKLKTEDPFLVRG